MVGRLLLVILLVAAVSLSGCLATSPVTCPGGPVAVVPGGWLYQGAVLSQDFSGSANNSVMREILREWGQVAGGSGGWLFVDPLQTGPGDEATLHSTELDRLRWEGHRPQDGQPRWPPHEVTLPVNWTFSVRYHDIETLLPVDKETNLRLAACEADRYRDDFKERFQLILDGADGIPTSDLAWHHYGDYKGDEFPRRWGL